MHRNFNLLFRSFHRTKSLISGLQNTAPASVPADQLTCISSPLLRAMSYSPCAPKCLHLQSQGLVQPKSVFVEQRRGRRKVYPDPFEGDPDYYTLPEEDYSPEIDINYIPELNNNGPGLVKKVHETITGGDMGRLFAVVHIDDVQRKITAEDLLVVNGYFPPQIGDRIRLEKIFLVGSKDFTLIGRPLLNRDLVKVEATVIEKTLSHVKVHYTYKKKFRRFRLRQSPQTLIVINSIELDPSALS